VAQQHARADGVAVVGLAYMLLGFLDSDSRTRDQLAVTLGDDFDRAQGGVGTARCMHRINSTGLVFDVFGDAATTGCP